MTRRRKSNGFNRLMDWNWNKNSTNQIQMEVEVEVDKSLC